MMIPCTVCGREILHEEGAEKKCDECLLARKQARATALKRQRDRVRALEMRSNSSGKTAKDEPESKSKGVPQRSKNA